MKRFLLRTLVCVFLAWIASGWLIGLVGQLSPVTLTAEVKTTVSQSMLFFYRDKLPFPARPKPQQKILFKISDEWKEVYVNIPRNKAAHIRIGFSATHGIFEFKNVFLNGQSIDLTSINEQQKRNIRACEPQPEEIVSCRIAGQNSYMTLPPSLLRHSTNQPGLYLWRLCFVVLLFYLFSKTYRRLEGPVSRWLHQHYPVWTIFLLSVGTILGWFLCKWNAFYTRLEIISPYPSFKHVLLFIQANALAIAVFSICIILLVSVSRGRKYWKWWVGILGTLVLWIEIIDAALVQLLNARLMPYQAVDFGMDLFTTIGPFARSFFSSPAGKYAILALICWTGICLYGKKATAPLNLSKKIWYVVGLSLLWYVLPLPVSVPGDKIQICDWPHTQVAFLQRKPLNSIGRTETELQYTCVQGLNGRQNILIILIESLSSYMSSYFSNGDQDLTPHLDALARQYLTFTHHQATNYDTVQSLFSILTGIPPLHLGPESAQFKDPRFFRRTLPGLFNKQGYVTALFTSASLVYSKDDIIQRADFEKVSQDIDPFYKGHKRFVFNSVSDDVLYARFLQWLQKEYNPAKPYLAIVETTTTHSPYIDPLTGEESIEGAVQYADNALGQFIEQLQQNNLLQNTLVVITSDHRAMLPMDPQQPKRFGETAETRIPLIILGAGKQVVSATTTHTDLAPSLAYLALPQACFHTYQENMFTAQETKRKSCTFFQSFLNHREIIVDCRGQVASICLQSQGGNICKGQLDAPAKEEALSFIDWVRDHNRY